MYDSSSYFFYITIVLYQVSGGSSLPAEKTKSRTSTVEVQEDAYCCLDLGAHPSTNDGRATVFPSHDTITTKQSQYLFTKKDVIAMVSTKNSAEERPHANDTPKRSFLASGPTSLQETTTDSTTREGGETVLKISHEAPLEDSSQVNAEATTSRRVTGCFETETSSTTDGTSKKPSDPDGPFCMHDTSTITKQVENHEKAAQSNDVQGPPTKKRKKDCGRQAGAANYTDEEVECLLEAVGQVQPTSDDDWETVKVVMQALAPPGAPVRSKKSLKAKFTTVSLKLVKKALASRSLGERALQINPLGPMLKGEKTCTACNADQVDGKEMSVDRVATNESVRSGLNSTSQGLTTLEDAAVGMYNSADVSECTGGDSGDMLDVGANTLDDDDDNEDGDIEEEAEKLSNSMITFFEQFNTANGMILGKDTLDSFAVRLQQIERNVNEMKGAVESMNTNMGAILSALQKL